MVLNVVDAGEIVVEESTNLEFYTGQPHKERCESGDDSLGRLLCTTVPRMLLLF